MRIYQNVLQNTPVVYVYEQSVYFLDKIQWGRNNDFISPSYFLTINTELKFCITDTVK